MESIIVAVGQAPYRDISGLLQTSVAPLDGGPGFHLVAMSPSLEQIQEGRGAGCFLGFVANEGMYGS